MRARRWVAGPEGQSRVVKCGRRGVLVSVGWVCYAEKSHAEALPHISTVKSPQGVMGTLVKRYLAERCRPPRPSLPLVSSCPSCPRVLRPSLSCPRAPRVLACLSLCPGAVRLRAALAATLAASAHLIAVPRASLSRLFMLAPGGAGLEWRRAPCAILGPRIQYSFLKDSPEYSHLQNRGCFLASVVFTAPHFH